MNTVTLPPSHSNRVVYFNHASVVIIGMVGNGFLIASRGHKRLILTCHHVVNAKAYRQQGQLVDLVDVHIVGSGVLAGEIVYANGPVDIALILVTSGVNGVELKGHPLKLSEQKVCDGMEVVMLGHFFIDSSITLPPGTSHGTITTQRLSNGKCGSTGTYTSAKGNSGSPVFLWGPKQYAEVIGVHVAASGDSREYVPVSVIKQCLQNSLNLGSRNLSIAKVVDAFFEDRLKTQEERVQVQP